MLELRLKHSELSVFENRPLNIYTQSLKKQVQRIIKSNYTTYFFSFSNFKILHGLIKTLLSQSPTGFSAHQIVNS